MGGKIYGQTDGQMDGWTNRKQGENGSIRVKRGPLRPIEVKRVKPGKPGQTW